MAGIAAVRYAQSLIQLATERGEVDSAMGDMEEFSRVMNSEPQLARVLKSPVIPSDKKNAILKALFSDRFNPLVVGFIDLISKHNREAILGDVAGEFVRQYNLGKGITTGTVTVAAHLGAAEMKSVEALAKSISGMTVKLDEKIDPSVMGGFLLRIGDKQIDQTVASRLDRVRRNLKDETFTAKI
jgi:F-type H+-transporting ATPase subunit delta